LDTEQQQDLLVLGQAQMGRGGFWSLLLLLLLPMKLRLV
jgi:hypothetical protein